MFDALCAGCFFVANLCPEVGPLIGTLVPMMISPPSIDEELLAIAAAAATDDADKAADADDAEEWDTMDLESQELQRLHPRVRYTLRRPYDAL